jgi:hypothetical protein
MVDRRLALSRGASGVISTEWAVLPKFVMPGLVPGIHVL